MAYLSRNPNVYWRQLVGDGQCVAFVKAASGAPPTALWREGLKVKGLQLAPGTAIATFQNGRYMNDTHGKSHAAIYISQDAFGILVWEQWVGKPVHQRVIRFKG